MCVNIQEVARQDGLDELACLGSMFGQRICFSIWSPFYKQEAKI